MWGLKEDEELTFIRNFTTKITQVVSENFQSSTIGFDMINDKIGTIMEFELKCRHNYFIDCLHNLEWWGLGIQVLILEIVVAGWSLEMSAMATARVEDDG